MITKEPNESKSGLLIFLINYMDSYIHSCIASKRQERVDWREGAWA